MHKAGFVSIIGSPNVGKSTLMNILVGERLAIISPKAQTTRHRVLGIVNTPEYQVVYSDTPGMIKPVYELQRYMMRYVEDALEDADIALMMTEVGQNPENCRDYIEKVNAIEAPIVLVINKTDKQTPEKIAETQALWQAAVKHKETFFISALNKEGVPALVDYVISVLPEHPPYYPKDQLTDRPERFFAAEIVREKIMLNYKEEVPYSCEVIVSGFKEKPDLIIIQAEIYVERPSQKGIIIGHEGSAIKKVGVQSRETLEAFFGKQVHIELFVKVEPDWRANRRKIEHFGYNH